MHGDLAARNVLLSENNVVKICDFGLAKNLYNNEHYKKKSRTQLPVKWLALESIYRGIFSVYSDVWSFGIEIIFFDVNLNAFLIFSNHFRCFVVGVVLIRKRTLSRLGRSQRFVIHNEYSQWLSNGHAVLFYF